MIYVGKWDLLPKDWEGVNGLYEKSEEEIKQEVGREMDSCSDPLVGSYTAKEFEDTFNGNNGDLNGSDYWMKII